MKNNNKKRVIAATIAIILAVAMVLPMALQFLL